MNQQLATIDQIKNTVIDLAIRFGPKVLIATLILLVGFGLSRWVSRWVVRALHRVELEPPARSLLERIVWALSLSMFVILALQNLGVELLPLLAGLGVVGGGIALATQGVLGNLVAGLSIIFTKPFRVGEYISIVGEEGVVNTITLFETTLTHVDRSRVVIPNRKIVGEILQNYGTIRQLDIIVSVAYDSELKSVVAKINEVLDANSRVLKDPPPEVQAVVLGDWSVSMAVRPWVLVRDYVAALGEINLGLLESFRTAGIIMPVPQREVRLIGSNVSRGLGA